MQGATTTSARVYRRRRDRENPDPFLPHPNLDDRINRNICRSEIEGGVYMDELRLGAIIEVETRNRFYRIEKRGDDTMLISGHPEFCPEPVLCEFHGSTWGGSMIKVGFIGRGMHMEFRHPVHRVILTSCVEEIRELPTPLAA